MLTYRRFDERGVRVIPEWMARALASGWRRIELDAFEGLLDGHHDRFTIAVVDDSMIVAERGVLEPWILEPFELIDEAGRMVSVATDDRTP